MNKLFIYLAAFVAITLSGCGSTAPANTSTANNAAAPAPKDYSVKSPAFGSSAPDTAEAVKFPFEDFPPAETTAKPGEYVLVPSYNWIKDAAEKGVESTSFIRGGTAQAAALHQCA